MLRLPDVSPALFVQVTNSNSNSIYLVVNILSHVAKSEGREAKIPGSPLPLSFIKVKDFF